MKKPPRSDYAFSVGRVRAMEKYLVPQEAFKEACEEKDLPCALKIIFDAGVFYEEKISIQNSEELDEWLAAEREKFVKDIEELFLERDVLRIVVDSEDLRQKWIIAQHVGYSFISDYARHLVDLGNLKIFLRIRYRGLVKDKLESLFLEGGFFDPKILEKNFDANLLEIGEVLYATPYKDIWDQAVDALMERETFIEMERGFSDFLMQYLRKAKYIVFGPEPVFAFALAKLKEFDMARLLGIGKLNQIPKEILKQRVSETYV